MVWQNLPVGQIFDRNNMDPNNNSGQTPKTGTLPSPAEIAEITRKAKIDKAQQQACLEAEIWEYFEPVVAKKIRDAATDGKDCVDFVRDDFAGKFRGGKTLNQSDETKRMSVCLDKLKEKGYNAFMTYTEHSDMRVRWTFLGSS
jgi:hypothetical protein